MRFLHMGMTLVEDLDRPLFDEILSPQIFIEMGIDLLYPSIFFAYMESNDPASRAYQAQIRPN